MYSSYFDQIIYSQLTSLWYPEPAISNEKQSIHHLLHLNSRIASMAAPNTLITVTAPTHFPIKLTSQNFSVWRRHVQSTLIGLGLDDFLTGGVAAPPKTLTDTAGQKPNPAYTTWFRQDQVIFSAILGSCSDDIQPLIASALTAQEAWERLTTSFASTSRSRIISLKSKLAKNPRGTRSVSDFMNEMHSIADELALVQSPIQEEDLMVHILTQLGDEYGPITAALKVREHPISYPELLDKLMDFERSLTEAGSNTPLLATANATQRHQGHSSLRTDSQHRPPDLNLYLRLNGHLGEIGISRVPREIVSTCFATSAISLAMILMTAGSLPAS